MITFQILVFWSSIFLMVYTYLGYPALIYLTSRLRHIPPPPDYMPTLTLIIPAHNEQRWIQEKIKNTLALDYPRERIQIVVASDGSTDNTVAIAREYEAMGLTVAVFKERHGKQEMLNILVPKAIGEIVVLTDTNALLQPDSIRLLVRHFADPQVGCVTGRRLCIQQAGVPQGPGESLYWRYESWIKSCESRIHSCLGAHGQLFAVRRSVFPRVEKVGEDFYIPMKVISSTGMRALYESGAIARTPAAANLSIEFERKTRAHVSFLITLSLLPELLLPWKTPVWRQYISHHVMRMLVPGAMIGLLATSAALGNSNRFYFSIFLTNLLFYLLAGTGFLLAQGDVRIKLFYIPFYFTFANLAIAQALVRWPRKKYEYAWKPTERLPISS